MDRAKANEWSLRCKATGRFFQPQRATFLETVTLVHQRIDYPYNPDWPLETHPIDSGTFCSRICAGEYLLGTVGKALTRDVAGDDPNDPYATPCRLVMQPGDDRPGEQF